MNPRYVPTTVLIHNNLGAFRLEVIGSKIHPANAHKSCIKSDMVALELITGAGSRWYGIESGYINSELRMVIVGTNERDEVRMKWPIVPEELR